MAGTPDPLLRILHLYHFADVRNLPMIKELDGIYSAAKLKETGAAVAANVARAEIFVRLDPLHEGSRAEGVAEIMVGVKEVRVREWLAYWSTQTFELLEGQREKLATTLRTSGGRAL